MSDSVMIAACASAIGGVAILRAAWARPNRSMLLNAAGWALLLGGALTGWNASGAWGMSIASLAAMTAAFAALGWAAGRSAPGRQKPSNRQVRMLPEQGEPLRIGRRMVTFVLVTFVAALLAIGLAVGFCGLARIAGWSEADRNCAAILFMPLAWAAIAFAVLMQPRRKGQVKMLLAASLPVWPALATSALA